MNVLAHINVVRGDDARFEEKERECLT